MLRLTPAQRKARDLIARGAPDEDGYTGLMWTGRVAVLEDGVAWVYFRTALALEKKGVVELDTRFGRVRIKP